MPKKIVISNSGRLHFNSLKMNAEGGRGCGGIGVAVKKPIMKLAFSKADRLVVSGGSNCLRNEITNFAREILEYLKLDKGVKIKILDSFPNQIGLGSGTQLGLSVGKGISLLFDKKLTQLQIAKITRRSGVSGIGYYAFSQGGLVIDGGYKMGNDQDKKNFADHSSTPPPLLGRYIFPKEWKILLLTPKETLPKISNLDEGKFFSKHTPVPMDEVGEICTNVFMGMVPAMKEKDYFRFMEYFSKISRIGTKKIELELNREHLDYFNKNLDFLLADKLVRKKSSCYEWKNKTAGNLLDKYPKEKIPFLALSSLGPTFFSILLDGYHDIDRIMDSLNDNLPSGWSASLTEVNNSPAGVEIFDI